MNNKLYQKLHGIPGIPLSAGINGTDGNGGNNVYFGYVYDFFDSTTLTTDTILRIATKAKTSGFYTGIYTRDNKVLDDYTEYPAQYSEKDANIYNQIDETSLYGGGSFVDEYVYSYPEELQSRVYVKADTNKTGLDAKGNSSPWNRSDAPWKQKTSEEGAADTSYPYPYAEFNGKTDTSTNFKPGKNVIRRNSGFSLFSILIGNTSYTFSDKNEKYEPDIYGQFIDNAQTSVDNPTIQTLRNNYIIHSQGSSEQVDYLKYTEDAVEEVMVTDKLRSDIKAGDVIYFYTQKNSRTIEYMTVITPQLERCTIDELIAASVMLNPFTFQYIDSMSTGGNNYVYTINNTVSVFYKADSGNSYVKQYGANLASLISYISKSSMNLGIIAEKTESTETVTNELMHLQSGQRSSQSYEFSIYGTHGALDEEATVTVGAYKCAEDSHKTIPLKISNMQIRENNIGNLEAEKCFNPNDFVFDYNGFCYTLEEGDFNYATGTFTIDSGQLVSSSVKDYKCGILCITYDKNEKSNVFNKVRKYIFGPEDKKAFTITRDFGDDTVHDILLWVEPENGLRHYSRHTIAKYDIEIDSWVISLLDDLLETASEESSSVNDPTIFEVSGISVDEMSDGNIDIYVPQDATQLSVYINSQKLTIDEPYKNSWCTISVTDTAGVVITDPADKEHYQMRRYRLNAAVKDNIPQLGDDDITTAAEFIASPGTQNSPIDGCTLFNSLMKGTNVASKSRNVTVSAIYMNSTKEVHSYYKVVQPGYAETRKVPKVALNLRKDLNTLELSNQSENGVLCNQFQFFMDVIISDFERSNWGSFVEEDDVTLNMDIVSAEYDYDFISKYQVQSAIPTTNLHINTPENDIDCADNYCMIRTFLVGTDIGDETGTSQILLDESHVNLLDRMDGTTVEDSVYLSSGDSSETYTKPSDNYYKNLGSGASFTTPDIRNTGLTDAISIKLRNIKFSNIRSGRLRVRVLMEFGNPLFSRLFFKFYVRDMWVSYKQSDSNEVKFYVGRSNLMKRENQGGAYTETSFMYASEPLRAFICPLSMTVIDENIERELEFKHNAMKDGSMLSGTDNQDDIYLHLSQYVTDVEIMSERERNELYATEQSVGWFEYLLKKKWFQDNVRGLSVQPLSPLSLKDTLSQYDSFINSFDTREKAFDEINSTANGLTDYLSIIYNSNIFPNRRKLNDKNIFLLDYEQYEADRYNQWNLRAPAFVSQDMMLEVRDEKLYNSVNIWNGVYEQNGKKQTGIFSGHISPYGNGYMFLGESADENQYDANTIYSLNDTVEENDTTLLTRMFSKTDISPTTGEPEVRTFYTASDNLTTEPKSIVSLYMTIAEPATPAETMPENEAWHRSILYQLKWQYPKRYTENTTQNEYIDAYNIVPAGKYFFDTRKNRSHQKEIPHNLTYSLHPRCAYDYENDNTIVFMLRCPSISRENQYEMTADRVYCSTPSDYQQMTQEKLNILN